MRGRRNRTRQWQRALPGQGLVEFMLVLPILLLLLLGTIELGRMFLIFAESTTASREASRYGASVGSDGMGNLRYLDCTGMRAAARRMFVMSDVPDSAIAIACRTMLTTRKSQWRLTISDSTTRSSSEPI